MGNESTAILAYVCNLPCTASIQHVVATGVKRIALYCISPEYRPIRDNFSRRTTIKAPVNKKALDKHKILGYYAFVVGVVVVCG